MSKSLFRAKTKKLEGLSHLFDRVIEGRMRSAGFVQSSKKSPLESHVERIRVFFDSDDEKAPDLLLNVAGRGNLEEFIKLYSADPKRLEVQDNKGQRPIHVAAAKGRLNILDYIIEQHAVLDGVDEQGDTALHAAVRHNQCQALSKLLHAGADHSILNNQQMAPLHLASELGLVDAVRTLVTHPGVDPDLKGEMGGRPLHYCCQKDNAECAKILVENGAKVCSQCNMGFFPFHLAAKCAAANTLEVLIQEAIKNGYKRESVLTFKDKENNMPLHAAVNGGNIKAVEVCLKAGAPVNTQQDDKSTPVHFAAAQGNLDMIKLMHSLQRDHFLSALSMCDAMNMTPLHRAALFNHKAVVDFILNQGADINTKDSTDCTPLLLAASKGCWDTVQILVFHGANVRVRDHNSRNFLHLAIRFGGKLGQFFTQGEGIKEGSVYQEQTSQDIHKLLDEKDDFGCTPLHYASKEGHLLALDDLIKFGATPSLKNNDKQSPFHFAARYGRYNTCRRLLELAQGPNIINETDGEGLTGLHIAALNGHTKIISMLLQKGAVVQRDNEDNTPLHHAASQGWTQCMKTFLAVHSNLLDIKNIRGETALHLAAQNGRASAVSLLLSMGAQLEMDKSDKTFFDYVIELKEAEVALAVVKHHRWEEVLRSYSIQYGCPFLGLIEHMPVVCESVLDRCQVHSQHDKHSADYHIEYNYRFLSVPIKCIEKAKQNGTFQPMMTLNAMVQHERVNCLSHPVCVSFLKLKWNTYGLWFYLLVLGLYVLFLASLTSFIVQVDSFRHHDRGHLDNMTMLLLQGNESRMYQMPAWAKCAIWIVAVYSILNMLKEVLQMITQRLRYFYDGQNVFEWILYVTSLLFAGPFIFTLSFHWQWEAGALAVFFAWFNLLVTLQRFDFFGIYVVMFLEILRTLLQALCVFSVLIVAFGLSFFLLLRHESSRAYSTPGLSLLRTVMMMLELDYMATFNEPFTDGDDTTLHFGGLTLFMVAAFVLLMPILLMNLLIGLAVGDIESVQRNARLKRLAGQVELHSHMESKMPLFMLARFELPCYKYYPNKCRNLVANVMSKMTADSREEISGMEGDMHRQALMEELFKQKKKVKEMGSMVEKNNQLLKLIVQKMEIHTEDDAWDEGSNPDKSYQPGCISYSNEEERRGSNTNSLCRRMLYKTSAVSLMQRSLDRK